MEAISVEQLSSRVLINMNKALGKEMKGDVVFINCVLVSPLDDQLRIVIESLRKGNSKTNNLIIILETNGGYMEIVERLVAIMRTHYKHVSFVIPDYAYSAGTVLALSGDEIFMDYYSVLGPIDPQIQLSEGKSHQSGYGHLTKYNEITKKINDSQDMAQCQAELAYLIKKFEPAHLFAIEQAIEHGISLITAWLPQYKFKSWKKTATRGVPVTVRMKKTRARKIAETLGNASKWHSHGRGISLKELTSPDIKLLIDDFGKNSELSEMIRNYHGLAVNFFSRGYIHSTLGHRRVM